MGRLELRRDYSRMRNLQGSSGASLEVQVKTPKALLANVTSGYSQPIECIPTYKRHMLNVNCISISDWNNRFEMGDEFVDQRFA